MVEFKLPDIGEGTVEGEIVRWLVRPGDRVKQDQPVVEVMTDKATVELTAPRPGTIQDLRIEAGKVAKVGQVIYTLAEEGEAAAAVPAKREREREPAKAAAPARGDGGRAREAAAAAPEGEGPPARKPLATPATRKLARELGVDLAAVEGSGPSGRVTDQDVRAAAGGPAAPRPAVERAFREVERAPAPRAFAGEESVERVPFRGIRKAISQQMMRSLQGTAQFTYVEEVDMTEVVRFRESAKEEAQKKGVKLTYLPFIVKAACAALKKHPVLNSELDEKAAEVLLKKYYHIGISIQADAGLSVGVIKHADRRSLYELGAEIDRLVGAVRAGKARPEDLKGSTFTITSAGNLGGVLATPIINWPEVGILGVNQIKKRPVVRTDPKTGEDEIAIRHMMFLSLTLDHRVVDGAVGAQFMNDVAYYLEDPRRLLLEA